MTPNVPEAYLKLRREQIIGAAVSCFARKGFHKTTMQDICQAAGLSPGAVYNYFDSKEAIVEACAEMAQERNEKMLSMVSEAEDAVSAYKKISGAWFSMIKQENMMEGIKFDLELWAESTRNERVARSFHKVEDAIKEKLTEFVIEGQKQGVFSKKLDVTAIVQVLFSLVNGLEVQKASNPEIDVDAYATVCSAIIEGELSSKNRMNKSRKGKSKNEGTSTKLN